MMCKSAQLPHILDHQLISNAIKLITNVYIITMGWVENSVHKQLLGKKVVENPLQCTIISDFKQGNR